MITVECLDHLHRFVAASGDRAPICPECGCRYVRVAGRHGSQPDVIDANIDAPRVRVAIEEGRAKVGGGTWLDTPAKFVEMVRRREPAVSDRELGRMLDAWHPKGGK